MNYLYILYLSHFYVEMQNQLLKTENAENGPPAPERHTNPRKKTEPPSRSEKSPSAVKIP